MFDVPIQLSKNCRHLEFNIDALGSGEFGHEVVSALDSSCSSSVRPRGNVRSHILTRSRKGHMDESYPLPPFSLHDNARHKRIHSDTAGDTPLWISFEYSNLPLEIEVQINTTKYYIMLYLFRLHGTTEGFPLAILMRAINLQCMT